MKLNYGYQTKSLYKGGFIYRGAQYLFESDVLSIDSIYYY